jgi:hypothetical protein
MTLTLEATLNKLTSPDAARRNRPRLPARGRMLILSAVMTVALLVALPGAAAAQASSPTSAQYNTTNHQIAGGGGGGGPSEPSGGNDPVISGLPFTGVDLVLLGIVALALLSAGIALQRLSRTAESDERI